MEMEARYPNGGNNNLTKWRWKQGTQMEAIITSRNGDGSKVRTQMESEDGFGKLTVDHEDKRDTMRTGLES